MTMPRDPAPQDGPSLPEATAGKRLRIAVTGASGFLGRHVLDRLSRDHEVLGLSRRGSCGEHPGYAVDVRDRNRMEEALAGCDMLVHAAGVVSHEPEQAAQCWDVHVNGTMATLDAAAAAGVRRVVYVSTSGTVAVSTDPVVLDERAARPSELVSRWPYYRSKLFAEDEALQRSRRDFEVVSLNPSLLLGPGDPTGEANKPVLFFLQGRIASSPSGGLSFVDVRDVAEAVESALTRGQPGHRYLLGAANWRFSDFYGRLARLTGLAAPALTLPRVTRRALAWLPELGRDGFGRFSPITRAELELACHFWFLDHERAHLELGWTPRDPLETLEHTIRGRG